MAPKRVTVNEIILGRVKTIRADPPAINEVPWNKVTLTFTLTGKKLAMEDLNKAFSSQLGMELTQKLDVRLDSVRVYDNESQAGELKASFYTFSSRKVIPGRVGSDAGDKNHRAAIQYCWSLTDKSAVFQLPLAKGESYPLVNLNTEGCFIHLKLNWRIAMPLVSEVDLPRGFKRVL